MRRYTRSVIQKFLGRGFGGNRFFKNGFPQEKLRYKLLLLRNEIDQRIHRNAGRLAELD